MATDNQPESIASLYQEVQQAQGKQPSEIDPSKLHVTEPQQDSIGDLYKQIEDQRNQQSAKAGAELDVMDKTKQMQNDAQSKASKGEDNPWATLPWYQRIASSAVNEFKHGVSTITTGGEQIAGWIATHTPDWFNQAAGKGAINFGKVDPAMPWVANHEYSWSGQAYKDSGEALRHMQGWAGGVGRGIGDLPFFLLGGEAAGGVAEAANLTKSGELFLKAIGASIAVPASGPKQIAENAGMGAGFAFGGEFLSQFAKRTFPLINRAFRGVADWRLSKAVEKARKAPVKLAEEPPVEPQAKPQETPQATPGEAPAAAPTVLTDTSSNIPAMPEYAGGMGPGNGVKTTPVNTPLYSEMGDEGLSKLVNVRAGSSAGRDLADMWVADSPDLAKGQHGNKGVIVEFKPGYVSAVKSMSKPMAAVAHGAEYRANYLLKDGIKKIVVKNRTELKRSTWSLLHLKDHGFVKKELSNGDIEFTHENSKPQETPQPSPSKAPAAAPADTPAEAPKPAVELKPEEVAQIAKYAEGQQYDEVDKMLGANAKYLDFEGVRDHAGLEKMLNDVTAGLRDTKAEGDWNAVQPEAETERLAQSLNVDPEYIHELYQSTSRDGGLAPRVFGAMRALLGSAAYTRDLARRAVKSGADEDYKLWLQQVHRHSALQAEVAGVKRQVARALRSMQIMQTPDFSFIQHLHGEGVNIERVRELAKTMSKTDNLAEIGARTKAVTHHGLGDAFLEVYINGLLSNAHTLVTNVISNAGKVMVESAAHMAAAGIGSVRRLVGQDVQTIAHAENLHAWLHGSSQGLWDALKVSRKGAEAALQAGRKLTEPSKLPWKWDWQAAKDVMAQNEQEFGTVWRALAKDEPVTDAAQKVEFTQHHVIGADPTLMQFRLKKSARWVGKQLGLSESKVMQALDKPAGNIGRGIAHAINLTGNTVRLPGRLLVTGDELFKTLAIQQAKHGMAYKAAMQSLILHQGDTAAVKSMMKDLMASDQFDEAAINFARYQTFQEQGGQLATSMRHMVNSWKPLRLILPFVKTPTNIIRQTLEHTPLALIMKTPRADGVATALWKQIVRGGPEADLAMGRMAVGTTAMYAAYKMHDDGVLTGGGPSDPRAKAAWLAAGNLPYSIKIGNEWVQYNRIDPMASWLGMMADYSDALKYDIDPRTGQEDDSSGAMAAHLGLAFAKNVTSKTWLSGLSRLLDAVNNPDRDAKSYLNDTIPSFMPFSSVARQITHETDPYMHETKTLLEAWKATLPGASKSVPLKRDILGRPIKFNGTLGPEWLSPLAVAPNKNDPVDKAIWVLRSGLSSPQRDLGGLPLTSAQYSDYLKLRGQDVKVGGKNFEQWFKDFVESDQYKQLTKGNLEFGGEAQRVVENVLGAYATMAKIKLFEKYPKLKAEYDARQKRKYEALLGTTIQ